MQYDNKFALYYDKIFSRKSYVDEVNFIFDSLTKYTSMDIKRVFDYGCGTGTHAALLSKVLHDIDIIGYDCATDMISLAKGKSANLDNCFFTEDLDEVLNSATEYGLVISMFYVVNHILSLDSLLQYFKNIASKTSKDGLFIFDCWNGLAASHDPPSFSRRMRYDSDHQRIVTVCDPTTDVLNASVVMKNTVEVYKSDVLQDEFSYTLEHRLWTPHILKELAEQCGFQVLNVSKTYDLNREATANDYKIVFVCKYRGEG